MGQKAGNRLRAALGQTRPAAGPAKPAVEPAESGPAESGAGSVERDWRDRLTSPSVLLPLLRRSDLVPDHRLGQNFLVDGNILRKMVNLVDPREGDVIVEVGAGLGTLTRPLGKRAGRVLALEYDAYLLPVLAEVVADLGTVEVMRADVLKLEWGPLLTAARERAGESGRVQLVGNLPYYLTSPLLYEWLGQPLPWQRLVITVQKEAAERLAAEPGSKEYGSLSVLCALRGGAKVVARLAPSSFYPRPHVWSALVLMERQGELALPLAVKKVVKACFGQRRKTMVNVLVMSGLLEDREQARRLLGEAGIDPQRRPETLHPEEFVDLAARWVDISDNEPGDGGHA